MIALFFPNRKAVESKSTGAKLHQSFIDWEFFNTDRVLHLTLEWSKGIEDDIEALVGEDLFLEDLHDNKAETQINLEFTGIHSYRRPKGSTKLQVKVLAKVKSFEVVS